MNENPFFSIVLSTYGRGRHIQPTIASVLDQSFRDFELIVVGDGCTDDTEATVRSFPSERITWRNLPQNSGSQSVPNNEGIRSSHGQWVAYIGHDDIWAPNHLESIIAAIVSGCCLDFVVSGCVYYGPKGSNIYFVNGLFDAPEAPFQHFFPPTSLAHRRDITTRIGEWRHPRVIRPPVDSEFVLRAAHAGLRFASTSRVTTHKFAAGHRYLSYLRVNSDEQQEVLRALRETPGLDVQSIIQISKNNDLYMAMRHDDHSNYPEGYLFERNRQNKGLSRPLLQSLSIRTVIKQTAESRALDWYGLEGQDKRYRWSGPNPRPKLLIPYTGQHARISIEVIDKGPHARLDEVNLFVEQEKVKSVVEINADGVSCLTGDVRLQDIDYTVLTLDAPTFCPIDHGLSSDCRMVGIAIGDLIVEPIVNGRPADEKTA